MPRIGEKFAYDLSWQDEVAAHEVLAGFGRKTAKPAIPTALTGPETLELQRLAKDQTVLEIGSLLGYSTIAMATVALEVVAVDPHRGYPEASPRPTLATFLQNLEDHGVADKVVPIIARGQQVLDMFSIEAFGFIFIDTMGDEHGTLELLLGAWALMPTALAVHDYGLDEWPGATKAIDRFAREARVKPRLVDTLAVFE
jgi:predicted O-methyltransferase YrrM